ncbi:hypothetical protein E2562_001467 [Oryza meyeriana var. granulata]|uniref:Uncharacterized protein n=1 Tax=Oryza meyeriana var. granulata TaxID=110450 RepID=A0A6G1DD00_9ORYZ|nr:hypothetical protein E2562_001467 [Oryza meyeriana var. granulata]
MQQQMVRCSRALLWFFALTAVLVQSSHGARPSPGEMQGRPLAASPVRSPTEELMDTGIIAAGDGRDADVAAPVATTTTPAVVGDRRSRGGDDVLSRRGRSVALVARLLSYSAPCLTAARRLLVAEASATDGAAHPSCRSNNMQITCSPPSSN